LIYKGDYSYGSGEKAADYFLSLDVPPTAIVCANDSMAIGAMKIIRENGFEIPEDISIIGFDDIEVSSRVFPTLTTVAAPIDKMAKRSVDILLDTINGTDTDYQHLILPTDLIIRNSSKSL